MPGQQEALRMKMGAESLCDAENDAAAQRSPQAPGAADHRRFESEDELQRTDIRIEIRSQSEEQAGKRDGDKRNRGGDRVHKSRIDADELDRVRVLGCRADWRIQAACR